MEKKSQTASTTPLSIAEIGALVTVLASEYNSTVPAILHKLDSVSGDLQALHRLM